MAPTLSGRPRAHNGNWNLAGPQSNPQGAPPPYDPQGTYIQEGYAAENPWIIENQTEPHFSLAGTFPRTVRWSRKPRGKNDLKAVNEAEKGQAEEAPQVAFAEQDMTQSDQQDFGGNNVHHECQYCHSDSTVPTAANSLVAVGSNESTDVEEDKQKKVHKPSTTSAEQRGDIHRTSTADTTATRQRQITAIDRKTGQPMGSIADEHTPEENPAVKPYNHWAYARTYAQRPLAEWLGTLILTFLGVSANLSINAQDPPGNTQTVYWAWGFALMIAIYIAGGASGGFVNPAIAVMLSVFRGFPAKRLPSYILAQVLGSFCGALLAYAVNQDNIRHFDSALLPSSTGTAFYTQPRDWIQPGTAFITETLGTAMLGCSIIALGDSGNSPPGAGMHAFIIGILLTAILMSLGYNTTGCFNPARDLGPRMAVLAVGYPLETFTAYNHWWLWGTWCADILGACVGALMYDVCIFKGGESPVNYSFGRWKVETRKEETGWLHRLGKHKKAKNLERDLENGVAARRKKGKQDTSPT